MANKQYEAPTFAFVGMKLSERIADTCFGLGYIYWDVTGNGPTSDDARIEFTSGCHGSEAARELNAWFVAHGFEDPHYGANVCNTKENYLYVPQS